MNNKQVGIVAFLVGAIVSAVIAHLFYARKAEGLALAQNHYSEYILRAEMIHDSIRVLKYLQTGNTTNALENNERNIDVAVAGLAWLAAELHTNTLLSAGEKNFLQKDILKVIGDAKKYRDMFPHKNVDPVRDREVSNAFALLNVQTNR